MADTMPNESRSRSDWSLASLAIGAVFMLTATPMLSLLLALENCQWGGIHPRILVAILGYIAGVTVVLLLLASTAFGIAGMADSRKRGYSIALGLAGFLLSAMNVVLWIIILLAWHSQVIHRV